MKRKMSNPRPHGFLFSITPNLMHPLGPKKREAISSNRAIAIEPFVSTQIRRILLLAATRAF
jgi:hypothetical protein